MQKLKTITSHQNSLKSKKNYDCLFKNQTIRIVGVGALQS